MTSEDIKELICEDDELACKKLLLYLHSNINLCLDEDGIEAGKDKNCRFNFFIKDENEIPHDFILECDDVKLEYLEKWK